MGISMASGAIDEERGAGFGDSFPWGLGWSARRRCGGVHVASSMGRETCPDSRYHIYRVITSPEMALLWVVEARVRQIQRLARVGWGRWPHFGAPEHVGGYRRGMGAGGSRRGEAQKLENFAGKAPRKEWRYAPLFHVVAKATTYKDLRREWNGCTPNTRA